ncbi:hypothetical protein Hanom_Chr16g01468451 [Helianthus anomalus]
MSMFHTETMRAIYTKQIMTKRKDGTAKQQSRRNTFCFVDIQVNYGYFVEVDLQPKRSQRPNLNSFGPKQFRQMFYKFKIRQNF